MEVKHTTFRNQSLFCTHCGGKFELSEKMSPEYFSDKVKGFNLLHKDCAPTWKEPEVNQADTVQQRALWWITNGEVGMSSKAIWNCFMNSGTGKPFDISHPYDPDDFSRCYKLLKAIPEWEAELHRMKPLSKAWSNLVDNWPKLKEMYEENERTKWKNYKQVGMYQFMQTLIE